MGETNIINPEYGNKGYSVGEEKTFSHFLNNNRVKYFLEQELLGFQIHVNVLVGRSIDEMLGCIKNDMINKISDGELTKIYICSLTSANITYLNSVFGLLSCGHTYPALSILRHVHESIPKLVYMLNNPLNIRRLLINDVYHEFKREYEYVHQNENNIWKEFIKIHGKQFYKREELEKQERIQRPYKSETNDKKEPQYRDKCYTKETLKHWRHLFRALSITIHPNLIKLTLDTAPTDNEARWYLDCLICISFMNALILVNTCSEELIKNKEIANVNEYMNKFYSQLDRKFFKSYLYPDKNDYQKLLPLPC